MELVKEVRKIKCEDAADVFSKLYRQFDYKFLLESKDISHIYGRLSLIGVDPAFEVTGKNDGFEIRFLNERAAVYMEELGELDFCDEVEEFEGGVRGKITKFGGDMEEGERTKRKCIAQVVRVILERLRIEERESIGLYGAFAYDFIRLFEDLPELLEDEGVADFRLQFYDTFVFFDHLKDQAEIVAYRRDDKFGKKLAKVAADHLDRVIYRGVVQRGKFGIEDAKFDLGEEDYVGLVENARELASKGELFEVVYSNTLRAGFEGDAFELYRVYSEINPSPYLFFFDFVDEQLVGASPEMMVRCENRIAHLRPISGTARRGEDTIEDHENMLELLESEKERAELDMLIDLGRNDLARICEPGIEIVDYRFVEKYSKVMHTVAHLSGRLRDEYTAFDSLIACLNAGTLTGAPKVAAMVEIEKNENSRRGYYGGSIGYLTLADEMNTGIVIRTAHIRDGRLSFRVGATLLYDSDPKMEYQETINKAQAFLTAIGHG